MYLETCEQKIHDETTTNVWCGRAKVIYIEIFSTYLHFSNIADKLLINVENFFFSTDIINHHINDLSL